MSKKTTKKWQTAAEYLAERQADTAWVRRRQARVDHFLAMDDQLAKEEMPILVDLANAGCMVNSVWDLVNTKDSYPSVISVLTNHLSLRYSPRIRQGLIRALSVPEACPTAGPELLRELIAKTDPPGSEERWALANALTVVADIGMVAQMESLLTDPSYADVHERLRVALKNLRVL